MKNGIIIVLVMVASIIHVHLNMYTVGNFINPSFWVYPPGRICNLPALSISICNAR